MRKDRRRIRLAVSVAVLGTLAVACCPRRSPARSPRPARGCCPTCARSCRPTCRSSTSSSTTTCGSRTASPTPAPGLLALRPETVGDDHQRDPGDPRRSGNVVSEESWPASTSSIPRTTTGTSATSRSSRCARLSDRPGRRRQLDQGDLLPDRLVPARRQHQHEPRASSGTARRATRGSRAGWVDQYHHRSRGSGST